MTDETERDGTDAAASPEEVGVGSASDDGGPSPAFEELVRAATRLVMGSAGLAVTAAERWQRPGDEPDAPRGGVGELASATLGLGLATERVVVRGASAVGAAAASVTWGIVHASPLRRPVERLADRFRTEQRLTEREVTRAAAAIVDAIGEAVLARIDVDRVIDRIALERVLARIDRAELARRIEVHLTDLGTAP